MKPIILHCIAVCLTLLALPCMVACGNQEESLLDNTSTATLCLNIGTIDATRAAAASLPDNEKMHDLRVIILHSDGTVEHNKFYSLDGPQAQEYVLLKVSPDENKKIFLFANEKDVSVADCSSLVETYRPLGDLLDSYTTGTPGFETAVNNLFFSPDFSEKSNIPMSSEYYLYIPDEEIIEKNLYVVRVATKFIVNFHNLRGDDVCVDNFSISHIADKNFLMAHVNDSEQNRILLNGKTWIEWLKDVSDASSEYDDYATTEAAGWLRDYELPEKAHTDIVYSRNSPVIVPAATFDYDNPENTIAGRPAATPVFYLPESKNSKTGLPGDDQEYTLSVNISGQDKPFVCKLPNLKSLFRNTNVVVNVTLFKNMDWEVEVIPFTSIVVEPEYGLGKDDFTGYTAGKDKNGNKCWYQGTAGPYYFGPADSHDSFVTINGKEYLLVYADYSYNNNTKTISGYDRTPYNLHHIIEKTTRKIYSLDPLGRTGYKTIMGEWGVDIYLNRLQKRVWLDSGGDPDPEKDTEGIYIALGKVGLDLHKYNIVYEWDRLDWNKARWWGWSGVYPKFWFDILGNRYSWEEGDTEDKRKAILGEWVKYLE